MLFMRLRFDLAMKIYISSEQIKNVVESVYCMEIPKKGNMMEMHCIPHKFMGLVWDNQFNARNTCGYRCGLIWRDCLCVWIENHFSLEIEEFIVKILTQKQIESVRLWKRIAYTHKNRSKTGEKWIQFKFVGVDL